MQQAAIGLFVLCCVATLNACECEPDSVQPGYYGVAQAGSAAPPRALAPATTANGGSRAEPAGQAGVGPAAAGASSVPPASSNAGSSAPVAEMPRTAGDAPSAGSVAPTPSGAMCDLTGRWLITHHTVADGLGQLQTIHTWVYAEIDQQGDAFTVTKGLECGDDVVARTDLGGNADFHNSWDAIMRKVSFAGRKGSSISASGGCKVHFDKFYTLKGATTPYYTDPSIPLPTIDQQAMGTTPGWEDWDQDGQPGVTGAISGLLTGKIYIASRIWSELSGTGNPSAVLKLDQQWAEETNILAYDGSPLLETQSVRAADASLHFAQLVRLADGEATGADDVAICAAIRKLAPMLTPEAAGI